MATSAQGCCLPYRRFAELVRAVERVHTAMRSSAFALPLDDVKMRLGGGNKSSFGAVSNIERNRQRVRLSNIANCASKGLSRPC
jgi:hypothetical protein